MLADFYLVVRRYRGKVRVLFTSPTLSLAETAYQLEMDRLRDGDLLLWKCSKPEQLAAVSGGYNRTRW